MKKRVFGILFLTIFVFQSLVFAEETQPYVVHDLGDVKIVCNRRQIAAPRGSGAYINENYGVIDKDGNVILEQIYGEILPPQEGRAAFYGANEKIGFFDENWKVIIEPKYSSNVYPLRTYFSDGRAAVGKRDDKRYMVWGYIDRDGNEVTDFIYDWAEPFENGKARVGIEEYVYYYNTKTKFATIDKEGNIIEPFKFNYDYLLSGDTVDVLLSENLVELNGRRYKNSDLQYPFINYQGISYFPLTYYGCRMLGISCDWTKEKGVMLTDKGEASEDITGKNTMKSGVYDKGKVYKGKVSINGKVYEYQDTPYPFISYKNVVYMPVLWQTGMEQLGIEYAFLRPDQIDDERGCMVFKTK